MDNAVQMVKSGVNNLRSILPSDQALPVTRLVDAVMEGKANLEADQFLYFDPKSSKKTDGRTLPKTKTTFQSGTVFMVGGGNFPEYMNLQEYAQVPMTTHPFPCSSWFQFVLFSSFFFFFFFSS